MDERAKHGRERHGRERDGRGTDAPAQPADASARPATREPLPRLGPVLLLLLALDALGVIGIWTLSLRRGAFEEGLFTFQLQGNVPIFHLAAELGMALVTLVALAGWAAGRAWARPLLPFALGMLSYAAVNSLGWALHNDAATAAPMVATLVLAALTMGVLIRAGASARRRG